MLYVKIMSGEPMEDSSPYKGFRIIPVENNRTIQFCENPFWNGLGQSKSVNDPCPTIERYQLHVTSPEGSSETYALSGNAYVLSENGKTIASHSA